MENKDTEPYTETVNSTENSSSHDNDISDIIQNPSRLSISEPNLPVHRSDETYISEIYQSVKDQEIYEAKMYMKRYLRKVNRQSQYEMGDQTKNYQRATKYKR